MPDDFDRLLDEAEDLTKKELETRISSLTRMTDEEIRELFPKKADKEALIQLMSVVRGATNENEKRAALIQGISTYAGAVVKLLSRFV